MESRAVCKFYDIDQENKLIHTRTDFYFVPKNYPLPYHGFYVFGIATKIYTLLEIEIEDREYSNYVMTIFHVLVKEEN